MKRSIKRELIIISIFSILAAVGILLQIALNRSQEIMTETVKSSIHTSTELAATQFQNQSEKNLSLLYTLAEIKEIKDTEESIASKCEILSYFKGLHADYVNIFYADAEGNTINHLGETMNVSFIPSFWESMAGKTCIGNAEPNAVDGSISVSYSVPVKSMEGNIIGVICCVVDFQAFMDIIKSINVGKVNNPFVIEKNTGTIIAVNDVNAVGLNIYDALQPEGDEKALIDKAVNGGEGEGSFIDNRTGEKMIATYRPLGEGSTWEVLGVAPYNDFFSSFNALKKSLMIITVIIVIVAGTFIGVVLGRYLRPLIVLKKSIDEIASGNADLTQRINSKRNDEFGDVVKSFNNFIEKLQNIMKNLKQTKEDINSVSNQLINSSTETVGSITQIEANIKGVSGEILNQSSAVTETSTAINEISCNLKSLEKMIQNQGTEISSSSSAIEEMVESVRNVKVTMDKMSASFDNLIQDSERGSQKMGGVNEKITLIENESQMLQEANSAISAIAEQTNLLAMNAAIEAAHAGEAGKGFAVVADEIRKLSETSTAQSKTIGDQLKRIQESINDVVNASSESSEAFNSLTHGISQTNEVVKTIQTAMDEQAEGSALIIQSLANLNNSSAEVSGASTEMTAGSNAILEEIHKLEIISMKIQDSLDEINLGVNSISKNGADLDEVTKLVETNVHKMGSQIDLFTV